VNQIHAFNPSVKCWAIYCVDHESYYVTANGYIYARGEWINADFSGGKGTYEIDSALLKVLSLRGVYYDAEELKGKDNDTISFSDNFGNKVNNTSYSISQDSSSQYINQDFLDSLKLEEGRRYIGLIAQETEGVVPELVRTMPDGTKTIAYFGLGALLVEAIKDQQKEIDYLQEQIDSIKKVLEGYFETLGKTNVSGLKLLGEKPDLKIKSMDTKPEGTTTDNLGILSQNIPNPFSENTSIHYSIFNPVKEASIFIFDLQGALIKEYNNLSQNKGEIIIRGYELKPGMYFYTLMIDGTEVDTKRMILTK
jgi:hypothetical protein